MLEDPEKGMAMDDIHVYIFEHVRLAILMVDYPSQWVP